MRRALRRHLNLRSSSTVAHRVVILGTFFDIPEKKEKYEKKMIFLNPLFLMLNITLILLFGLR